MGSSSSVRPGDLGALIEDARAALAALAALATAVEAVAAAEPGRLADSAVGDSLVAVGSLAVQAGVAALTAADPGKRSDAALGEEIVALAGWEERLAAARLRWLAVFDGRGAGAGSRGGSTAGWLGWQVRLGPRQAAAQVRLARALSRRLPATAAALSAGQISVAHAHVLAAGTDELTEPVVTAGEPALLAAARTLTPHQLRAAVTHWRAHVAPEQADKDFADQHERRRLHISSSIDGLVVFDGVLDAEGGNTVLTAISGLAGPGGGADPRTSAQRRADALVELAATASITPSCPTPPASGRTSTSPSTCRRCRPARARPSWTSPGRSQPTGPAGWPATPGSAGSSPSGPASRWTWAGAPAPCPPSCGERWPSGTAAAGSRPVIGRWPGVMPITVGIGPTAGRPCWPRRDSLSGILPE